METPTAREFLDAVRRVANLALWCSLSCTPDPDPEPPAEEHVMTEPEVHLHASSGPCRTECDLPCDDRTAYRALDPDRVTCARCLEALRAIGHHV